MVDAGRRGEARRQEREESLRRRACDGELRALLATPAVTLQHPGTTSHQVGSRAHLSSCRTTTTGLFCSTAAAAAVGWMGTKEACVRPLFTIFTVTDSMTLFCRPKDSLRERGREGVAAPLTEARATLHAQRALHAHLISLHSGKASCSTWKPSAAMAERLQAAANCEAILSSMLQNAAAQAVRQTRAAQSRDSCNGGGKASGTTCLLGQC